MFTFSVYYFTVILMTESIFQVSRVKKFIQEDRILEIEFLLLLTTENNYVSYDKLSILYPRRNRAPHRPKLIATTHPPPRFHWRLIMWRGKRRIC